MAVKVPGFKHSIAHTADSQGSTRIAGDHGGSVFAQGEDPVKIGLQVHPHHSLSHLKQSDGASETQQDSYK